MPKSVVVAISSLSFLLVLNLFIFGKNYFQLLGKAPVFFSLLLEVVGFLLLIGLIFKKRLAWILGRLLAAVFAGIVLCTNIALLNLPGGLGLDWWLFFGILEISILVFLLAMHKPLTLAYFSVLDKKND
jgi:hypothetical protein